MHCAKPTDMCEYCTKAQRMRLSLLQTMTSRGVKWDLQFSVSDMQETLNCIDAIRWKYPKKKVRELVANLKPWEQHVERCMSQRRLYNEHRTSPPPDALVLDIDFKSKGSLPMGPVSTSYDFYHLQSFSALGIGVYWIDGHGARRALHVDCVLSSLNTDVKCVIECLKTVLASGFAIPEKNGVDTLD
eukprot:TRINITY_DN5261_c0_g2_i3.p2 TRINITY_DN5261_c0_g2~~TRINITY_DN5261_c0_g2_i3.p2  ORF type:complete len:187 (+),score=7.00 TRINITY_DN5261_c0_g2_i3:965-1525(+)